MLSMREQGAHMVQRQCRRPWNARLSDRGALLRAWCQGYNHHGVVRRLGLSPACVSATQGMGTPAGEGEGRTWNPLWWL